MSHVMTQHNRILVRCGLIIAEMTILEDGVMFHGPLTYNGELVRKTGTWSHRIDPKDIDAIADALCDTFMALHDAWCETKSIDISPCSERQSHALDLHTTETLPVS